MEPAVWHGQLELAFSREGERTAFERRRVMMPLAVQRPFYPEGPSVCHALLLHPPGGMVGGDRLTVALDVHETAAAVVSTPAAAKWYRGLAPAVQAARHRLASGARLEYLPQESIVFDGADVHQRTRVELGLDSVWLGWEVTRFGRTARGEIFGRGRWRMDTEVWRGKALLWVDRQRLDGGSRVLHSHYGLDGAAVVGTLAWIGKPVAPEVIDAARAAWDTGTHAGEFGVTRLEQGMLCRYRGPSSADARAWFMAVWNLLREFDGRRSTAPLRIWA
jgi:urease accessory protein